MVWYLGDEASAAGCRLAGARVATPSPDEAVAALAAARAEASLVLVSSRVASCLPARELARAELALHPLVLIVPDLRDDAPLPDRAARLRGQLGIEEPR
ncbi:MAG: V-type ATP synthase subunit F [Burkholderiales bacterium]